MSKPALECITKTAHGGMRIRGTRVSLDSVLPGHFAGQRAEQIVEDFPSLSVEKVNAATEYYEENRDEVDRHLAEQQQRWTDLKETSRNSPLLQRLRKLRSANSKRGSKV